MPFSIGITPKVLPVHLITPNGGLHLGTILHQQSGDYMDGRWKEVKELLYEAQQRPPQLRAEFLDEVCPDDELRAEVESLLKVSDDTADIFGIDGEHDHYHRSDGETVVFSDYVGPYKLLRPLNDGGMSLLYLAERADDAYDKQVAVKLLPRYFNTESYIERFRTERQILASLSHPGIASLIDGGVTEEGHPYLVMEYVDGVSILEYCSENSCSIDERIQLIRDVCEAVKYAHQNLIVHRDLKPSNILVTPDGRVKLVDFGIAKLLDEKWTDQTMPLTRTGQHWMTPEYAAPEQIRGEAITTSTDVYQLGVLTYELLSGVRPYKLNTVSLPALEREICGTAPPLPSRRAEQIDDETGEFSPEWTRRLKGELDTIIMKALRKEPDRRYASAGAFAADLDRHLAGLPINAMPATTLYRANKFIQRHQTGVTASAIVALMLLGYAVMLTMHSNRISEERDRAQLEAERAEAVAGYLAEMFMASDPHEVQGRDLTAETFLERGIAHINHLDDQPAIQAQMFDILGRVHRNLGFYEQSRQLLEQAVDIRRNMHGERHIESAESLENLGSLLGDLGDFERAEQVLRKALEIREAYYPGEVLELADTKQRLAFAMRRQGKYAEAEPFYRTSLETRMQQLGHRHRETLASMSSLGTVLQNQGKYEEAEVFYREAVIHRRHSLDIEPPNLAMSINNLGTLLMNMGQLEEAASLIEESREMRIDLYGEHHPLVALSTGNMGLVQSELGNLDLADSLLHSALDTRRDFLGPEHTGIAINLFSLGGLKLRKEEPEEALSYFIEAHEMFRRHLPADHSFVVRSKMGQGSARLQLGELDEAAELLHAGYEILNDIHPPATLERALADMQMGLLYKANNEFGEAARFFNAAYEGLQAFEGMNSPRQKRVRGHLETVWQLADFDFPIDSLHVAEFAAQ